MSDFPSCPKCSSSFVYEDGSLLVCPECAYEWCTAGMLDDIISPQLIICDAHGNPLKEGDTITLIKDLKIKGSSQVLKVGTKAKVTHFLDGDHDINCKLQGAGTMELKSEFVKKNSD